MNLQTLLGEAYKASMTIDEINTILADKNFVDPSTLPPSVPKATFDKTASELAKANKTIGELKNANLTDEEKLQAALDAAQAKEDEYNRKSIRLDVEKVLVQGGLTENDYKDIIDSLVTLDKDASIKSADSLVNMISNQKNNAAEAVKLELQNSLNQLPRGNDTEVTKDTFEKMSISEKMKFKIENPDTYKEIYGGN